MHLLAPAAQRPSAVVYPPESVVPEYAVEGVVNMVIKNSMVIWAVKP